MIKRKWPVLALFAGGLLVNAAMVEAGGKIEIDETKWISLGAAARASFTTIEDGAPNGSDWSDDFNLDSARIYVNGQIHEYIKFELNTECVFCGNSALEELVVLDAIARPTVRDSRWHSTVASRCSATPALIGSTTFVRPSSGVPIKAQ